MTAPEVLISNDLDRLYARLRQNFALLPQNPFLKCYVVVSDIHMKTVVQVELAKSSGVMFNQKIVTLEDDIPSDADAVHLFAVTTGKDDFFTKWPNAKVFFYMLSPCMHFFSDICSDREVKRLKKRLTEKQAKALQGYLLDRSKLLANHCILFRESISTIDEKLADFEEEYVVKKWVLDDPSLSNCIRHDVVKEVINSPRRCLDLIHNELLLLAPPQMACEPDSSFELHKAPTVQREVEVLYHYIQKIEPEVSGQIVVYAPDIELYRPYIKSLFTHSYQIIGTKENELLEPFLKICDLHYTPKRVIELFQNSSFMKKCGVDSSVLPLVAACLERFSKEEIVMSFITTSKGEIAIGSSDSEAIGKCLATRDMLYSDIQVLASEKLRSNLEWQKLFIAILERYFEPSSDFYLLKNALIKCSRRASEAIDMDKAIELFQEELCAMQLPALANASIIFTSIGALRSLPKDAVCFLGMNEEARIDSHLFIEAILTAKKFLHISYRSYSFKERSYLAPAKIVLDLLEVVKVPIIDHPLASSSEDVYFPVENSKNLLHISREVELPDIVYIHELTQAAKYPLKTYLQQHLGLYLQEHRRDAPATEFEVLDPKTFKPLQRQAFTLSKPRADALAAAEYKFLPPAVQRAACMLLDEEVSLFLDTAKELGLKNDAAITVELSVACKKMYEAMPNHYRIPAITVEIQGKPVTIAGTLTHIYPEGIVLFEKKTAGALYKAWPEILLLNMLKSHLPIESNVHFLKDGKKQAISLDNPLQLLQEYVSYAIECKSSPSCIYPDVVNELMQSKTCSAKLEKLFDPYLAFYLSRVEPQELEKVVEASMARAYSLFGVLHEL